MGQSTGYLQKQTAPRRAVAAMTNTCKGRVVVDLFIALAIRSENAGTPQYYHTLLDVKHRLVR